MPDPDLLTADLLPDWDDDWLAVHREAFRQLRLRALEALCAQQRRAGQRRQALYVALTAVSADPLAEHISWRFRYTSQPADDLRQVALLGLVLAVDRFDPCRGTGFVPFAVPTITMSYGATSETTPGRCPCPGG